MNAFSHELCAGGDNDMGNMCVTCEWCLPAKNRDDATVAAKGRRLSVKHLIPRDTYGKCRGFRGHRKFNGEIVWK